MRAAANRRIDTIVAAMSELNVRDQQCLAAAAPLLQKVADGVRRTRTTADTRKVERSVGVRLGARRPGVAHPGTAAT